MCIHLVCVCLCVRASVFVKLLSLCVSPEAIMATVVLLLALAAAAMLLAGGGRADDAAAPPVPVDIDVTPPGTAAGVGTATEDAPAEAAAAAAAAMALAAAAALATDEDMELLAPVARALVVTEEEEDDDVAPVVTAWGCGVECHTGTSVALLSGSAMEMSESRRSSFSVSSELRRMTGCDSMFISWPSGDASRLSPAPSVSPPPPRGTVFMDALPLRLTFMLSSFTSRSQKSVEMPRDWAVLPAAEQEVAPAAEEPLPKVPCEEAPEDGMQDAAAAAALPKERQPGAELLLLGVPQRRESSSEAAAAARRSLQRCWVKWLGNTCGEGKEQHTFILTCSEFMSP